MLRSISERHVLTVNLHDVMGTLLTFAPTVLLAAALLSALAGIESTVSALVLSFPILLVAVLYLTVARVPRSVGWYLSLVFLGWCVLTWIATGNLSAKSLLRMASLMAQGVLFIASLGSFCRSAITLTRLWHYMALAGLSFIAISNLLRPDLGIGLHYVVFVRYPGLVGENAHGFISAVTAMSLLNHRAHERDIRRRKVWLLLALWALVNVWTTGSRLSVLIMIVFLLSRHLSKLAFKHWIAALIVGGIIWVPMSIWVVENWQTLRPLLRLDDYSFYGRLNPLLWALEMSQQNRFMPFGLGELYEEMKYRRLDSALLVLLLEAGFVGLLSLSALVSIAVIRSFQLERTPAMAEEARSARAVLLALCAHGVGENTLFTGSNLATWIFWISVAFLYAKFWTYYKR